VCHADGCGGRISLNTNLRTNCTRCLSRAVVCVFPLILSLLEGRIPFSPGNLHCANPLDLGGEGPRVLGSGLHQGAILVGLDRLVRGAVGP
jgi:hypothetical protein